MAFETEYSLVCDVCRERSEVFDGAIWSKAMVLAELRKLGWVRRRGGRVTNEGDECPRCSGAGGKAGE